MSGRQAGADALDHPPPPEIGGEIFRGDAFERRHPTLQARDIGIHVLDVEPVVDALAVLRDGGDVQHSALVREGAVAWPAVGDEHAVAADDRFENGFERRAPKVGQHVVAGGLVAVADDDRLSLHL